MSMTDYYAGDVAGYDLDEAFGLGSGEECRQTIKQGLPSGSVRRMSLSRKLKLFRCKYCDKKGLTWKENDGKWRLHELNGDLHICDQYTREKAGDTVTVEKLRSLCEEYDEENNPNSMFDRPELWDWMKEKLTE